MQIQNISRIYVAFYLVLIILRQYLKMLIDQYY